MRKSSGLTLSNTTDIVANKISLIQGNTTTDILDLIGNAVANVDAYTRTESDARYYTQSQVNTALALKVNNTTLTNDYMTTTQINTALALKVNTSILSQYYTQTQTNTLLNNYMLTADVNTALGLKLDVSLFNSTIANYMLTIDINTALGLKVDSSQRLTDLADLSANYMLTTDVNTALGLKLDTTTFTNDIANYMLTADVNNALALKLDTTTFNSQIANYYTQTQTDTLLNSKQNELYSGPYGTSLLLGPPNYSYHGLRNLVGFNGIDVFTAGVNLDQVGFEIDSTVVALQTDIANYMLTTDVNTALGLKLDTSLFNSTISNYMLTTDVNNALALKLDTTTFNSQIANYDTSSTVDTKISNNLFTLTDNLQGNGNNTYQIYDNTNNLIRRIIATYPLQISIPSNSGQPEHDNIRISIYKDGFSNCYEIPSLSVDQYVRLGTFYSSTANDGRVCKFSVICNSNVGYEHQAIDVIFTTHGTGTTGSNGSTFLGRCTGKFYNLGIGIKVQQLGNTSALFAFYAYITANHKSSLIIQTNPNDSFVSEMTYGGLNVPTWSLVNSIDCVSNETYTATDVDNIANAKQNTQFCRGDRIPNSTGSKIIPRISCTKCCGSICSIEKNSWIELRSSCYRFSRRSI